MVCNTSGSGKTRLLLKGLSRNWGFYITARTQPDGVGSADLEFTLEDLGRDLEIITKENHHKVVPSNEKVARRRIHLVLYARFVCFRVFLECAAAMNNGITEDDKRRWLLIQLAPNIRKKAKLPVG